MKTNRIITHPLNRRARRPGKRTAWLLAAIVSLNYLTGQASADLSASEAALSLPPGFTRVGVGAGTQTRGYTFTLDAPRILTHLGVFNYNGTGQTDSDRPIGVWDEAGDLVAEATILTGAGNSELDPDSPFFYVALDAPVLLLAGELYTVGAHYVDNSPGLAYDFSGIEMVDGFHYGETAETGPPGGTFEKPTIIRTDRLNGYIGPNLRFSTGALPPRWVAFNDCVDTDPGTTPANATNFGLGRSYAGDGMSGNLLNFATGTDTGVTVTFTENTSAGNTINWATDPAAYPVGSDAESLFGGNLNLTGNMSYNDSPGWTLDLKFTGLDPGASYTFAGTAHRSGGDGYALRITNWTIMGAGASTFASSVGTHQVSAESVEFSTGNNIAGHVAKWTDIRPAADGSFTIRTSHGVGEANGGLPGADPYRGYAGGVFMLAEQARLPGAPNGFAITAVDYDPATAAATITWASRNGRNYAVDYSDDLGAWVEINDSIPADSDTSSFTDEGVVAPGGRRYYRVRETE